MSDLVKDGYLVADGLIGPEDLLELELEIKNLTGVEDADYPTQAAFTDAANLSHRLARFVTHPRVLGMLVSEFADDFVFLQHCDVLVNQVSGFMRHSVDRNEACSGECWDIDEPYGVVRVCLFTGEERAQVIPDSHLMPGKDVKKAKELMLPPGSVFVHDARLYTSFPELQLPRYCLTPFFGIPNKHSKRHHTFITKQRRDLGYKPPNPKLHRSLASSKVLYHD